MWYHLRWQVRESMSSDISSILSEWPYDEENNVRRITGEDGREKLQVRLPLGIEQYEVDGRPDGLRPEGCESYLEYFEGVAEREGAGWRLSAPDFAKLYEEGLLYYFRYLLFFRVGDYEKCARDTARNLRLADFVRAHAGDPEMSAAIEQYRPYILRMNAISIAVGEAKAGNLEEALDILSEAMEEIEELEPVDTQIFRLEKARSLIALRDLKNQLKRQEPLSRVERLKEELAEAVSTENYERAALLRDEIRRLSKDEERYESPPPGR